MDHLTMLMGDLIEKENMNKIRIEWHFVDLLYDKKTAPTEAQTYF